MGMDAAALAELRTVMSVWVNHLFVLFDSVEMV